MSTIFKDGNAYIIACPHCQEYVYVHQREMNCLIFRHGAYKLGLQPIHPHASKDECDRLVQEGLIYGCGKPFEIVTLPDQQMVVQICDYK